MTRSIKTLFLITLLFAGFSCKKEEITKKDPVEITPSDFSANVDENPKQGDLLGTLQVNTNSEEPTTFRITSQSVAGALAIDADGKLFVADSAAFNYEVNNKLTAEILVENSGISSTANVEITIQDVTELIVEEFSIAIDENPEEGSIGTIERIYDDNFPLTFSITNQTPAAALVINKETGLIEIADAALFDFETNPVITADVSVTNGYETVTTKVTITLTDVEEITVSMDNFAKNIVENSIGHGDILGTLTVNVTGETAALSYNFSLLSEDPKGALKVNNDGTIEVLGENYFNYELYPVITAQVQVSVDDVSAIATITINLGDDPTETVQKRLDDGETPMQIYYSSLSINDILGNDYAGGILATLDINTGIALILGSESSITYTFTDAYNAVSNLTDNGYTDWEMPNSAQMNAICNTLTSIPNAFPISSGDFWTTGTCGVSCRYTYQIGSHGCGSGGTPTSASVYLTPIRIYEDPNVAH